MSKNGNLLLNIGPKPDGTISEIQMDRLNKLGDWFAIHGEGIFDSRPWVKASSSPDVRFTLKENNLYAFVQMKPGAESITIPGVKAAKGTKVRVLGADHDSEFKQQGQEIVVSAPESRPLPAMRRGSYHSYSGIGLRLV